MSFKKLIMFWIFYCNFNFNFLPLKLANLDFAEYYAKQKFYFVRILVRVDFQVVQYLFQEEIVVTVSNLVSF